MRLALRTTVGGFSAGTRVEMVYGAGPQEICVRIRSPLWTGARPQLWVEQDDLVWLRDRKQEVHPNGE